MTAVSPARPAARLRHTKSSVRLLHFDCPKQASGARMCVRVICTRMRIVSSRPLRAVARSCWRRAPLGDHTQSMQTMVRIVLLFPSVFSLSFFGRIENIWIFFAILAFLEFLTFSRWFSSLKKRFKKHDCKTASPANHEMESFGLSWLLADGTTKACHPTWRCAR